MENSSRKQKRLIIFFASMALVFLLLSLFLLLREQNRPASNPDYAPVDIDQNAKPIPMAAPEEKLNTSSGGGAVMLLYSHEVHVDLDDQAVTLSYQNPERSTQSTQLQLVVNDMVLAESESVPPGYQLSEMRLMDGITLESGTYEGKFVITFYNETTHEKAMVNSEIIVDVTVE